MNTFPTTRTNTGVLPGGTPYAKIGTGPRTLVVLPGFGDAMFQGAYPTFSEWALVPYFARYLDKYTVYLLSRPRGLPPGFGADDAADSHVPALESLGDLNGSLDVIGISMGGLIGQELARRRPKLIARLVLANSAYRLAEQARPAVRHLEKLAREYDWFSIRAELTRAMFTDARSVAYPPLIQTLGRAILPRPAEPADVWRSLEFILEFDGKTQLEEIIQPTLVIGGTNDPYFTEAVARETADGMPNAEVTLLPGAKHGAFHERKWRFDSQARSFLERSHHR